MIELAIKSKCTGCSACCDACPQNAISMEYDEEGFLFPHINEALCCKCGLCQKTCPTLSEAFDFKAPLSIYAGWSEDKKMLKNSTSGGIFMSLCREVFSQSGVVFGAAFDDALKLSHKSAFSENEALSMQGSKYIQSNVSGAYKEAKGCLDENKLVLFSGTPCQIDGLYHYLKKPYENLITCEILCHGVGSTAFFEDVISENEKVNSSKAVDVKFRDKQKGWEDSQFKITFENGKTVSQFSYYSTFGYPFSLGYSNREFCSECRYSSPQRIADITLGDYSASDKNKYSKEKRKNGISIILVSTEKGMHFLESVKGLSLEEKEASLVGESNPALRKRKNDTKKRNHFFEVYKNEGYEAVKNTYATPPKNTVTRFKYRRQINFVYSLLKKLKLK